MKLSDLRDLDFSNVGQWPALAKAIAIVVIIAAVGGAGYWYLTLPDLEALEAARRTEQQLRQEFAAKQRVMANIDAYRAQIEEMKQMLATMLRQLPTRTEMPDLLEDVSNTGKRNGLNFELFKPENEQAREFYAAKPISIRARATYHQFAAFVSNIAALSRIVTVENTNLTTEQKKGERGTSQDKEQKPLLIEATLQTYRYLDEDSEGTAPNNAQGKAAPGATDKRKISQ
jgi:type IV pilus assembly protein PilO